MVAYTVIELDIHDPAAVERYEAAMADMIPHVGGRLLARETAATTLDGDWAPKLFVLIEFADKEAILRFYNSEEYAPLKALRQSGARSQVIAVDGIADMAP